MNKIDKTKNIIFIGSPQEFDDYAACVKPQKTSDRPDDDLLISITPSARARAARLGYESNSTMPYFSEESHKAVSKKAQYAMAWFRENAEFVDPGVNAQDFVKNAFIFYARLVVNYCVSAIEIITNAIDAHDPVVLKASLERKNIDSLYIKEEEGYFGKIVETVARSRGIRFEPFAGPRLSRNGIFSSIPGLAKVALKRADFLLWVKKISRKNPAHRPVVFATSHYQMDGLLEDLKKKMPDHPFYVLKSSPVITFKLPVFFAALLWGKRSRYIKRQIEMFEDLERKIIGSSGIFSYKGVSFAPILAQKLRDSIYNYAIGEMLWSADLNDFLDKARPAAILCGGNRMDDTLIAALCRTKKTVAIMISHGSLVRPKNEYENIEWGEQGMVLTRIPFETLVLQSPLCEGYLEAFPSQANILKTGPIIWGTAIDKNADPRKVFNDIFNGAYDFRKIKVVTHASSPKSYRDFRPFIYETLDEYIGSMQNLAKTVEGISGAVLIVRFRPRPEISVEDVKQLVPFSRKVVLNDSGPFSAVLSISDLVVSFSSTAIEEALQNKVPVLLYGGLGRYQHIPSCDAASPEAAKKGVICHVKDNAHLEDGLKAMLFRNMAAEEFSQYAYPVNSRSRVMEMLKEEITRCGS